MPKVVDHEQRRREIAEALWRIAERDGLDAISIRQVAAEAGVSVGHVQHYFTTRDEMLQFALERVGEGLEARLIARIGPLPEPRDPYQVIWIVLTERLPLTRQRRLQALATVTWLTRAALRPELQEYMVTGTHRTLALLADLIGRAQHAGEIDKGLDPARAAEGLVALDDGLIGQMLNGVHTAKTAQAVLADHLDRLFAHRERPR